MKIDQISSLTGRAANLLSKMLELAPLLQYAEFRKDYSTGINVPDKSTFTGSAARAVNAPIQKDNQTPNPVTVSLALYGRELGVDDLYKKDAELSGSPNGLMRWLDRQLSALAVKLANEIQVDMIQGTGTSNRMLGLGNFVKDAAAGGQTAALGFTAAEQAAMNTQVSLQLNTTANQDSFIETLFKKLAEVPGANAIICNANLASRLTTIAKRLGAAGESINTFGVPVTTFNNVPIVSVDTNTITQTESDGTNNDCTSLYIVRFAEELGVAFSTNSGFYFQDFQDYQSSPAGVSRMQFFLNLVVERNDALRRLSRIRL
ncbi:MAG: hypothetical protein NZM09_12080 [Ignavibacterium sp.]|nr:hypothetical protein [Ignavibacterium sp.]MDW8376413.1 hypothetical protein [Ignavibacteriales bacterium]